MWFQPGFRVEQTRNKEKQSQVEENIKMRCLRQWRRWIRPLVGVSYLLVLCVVLPLMIVGFNVMCVEKHEQAWLIAGVFVILAIPISVWGILQHLIHYTQPSLQRYIVRWVFNTQYSLYDEYVVMTHCDHANNETECHSTRAEL